jgi:hypothetical protein
MIAGEVCSSAAVLQLCLTLGCRWPACRPYPDHQCPERPWAVATTGTHNGVTMSAGRTWQWTPERVQAAQLLATRQHTSDREIADLCGVAERTIVYWKALPVFRDRVGTMMAQATAVALKVGIARKATRLRPAGQSAPGLAQPAGQPAGATRPTGARGPGARGSGSRAAPWSRGLAHRDPVQQRPGACKRIACRT